MDAFQKFPHFIDTDIRINRPDTSGYNVNYTLMKNRHLSLFPVDLVNGRSVLDLGCCVGATGAWVLDSGATSYTGVELQKSFANQAKENLSKSFSKDKWEIFEISFEEFFKLNSNRYDIVYAGGLLYSSLYYQELIKNIASIANVAVVVESRTPGIIISFLKENLSAEFLPMVQYNNNGNMLHENSANLTVRNATPSLGAVSMILDDLGFEIDYELYNKIKDANKDVKGRYGGIFYKKQYESVQQTTENLYKTDSATLIPWSATIPPTWEFNEKIAKEFVQHARLHIPDYDKVIDLSVKLCKSMLNDPLNDKIIDVGCATGETITRLYENGCCNLIGVDNSQAMLDQCVPDYAYYVLDNKFPIEPGPYSAVICNWTLHFIKDKTNYLTQIYNNLVVGGFIILTDKTENSGIALELYHDFKRKRGVSDEEIIAKANSVQNIMFIDPPEWYSRTLKSIGFSDVSIISSAPCFTTFIAVK